MESGMYLSDFQKKTAERNRRIMEMYNSVSGKKWPIMGAIAKEVGCTITTVYRIVGKEPKKP